MSTEAVLAQRRQAAVQALLSAAAQLGDGAPEATALEALAAQMRHLAAQRVLFPASLFEPAGSDGEGWRRHRLGAVPQGPVLYLFSMRPHKTTLAHSHATWAVIAAIDGAERNRIYRGVGLDADAQATHAQLVLTREVTVQNGVSLCLHAADIHAIEVCSVQPTLHLHLYGAELETLAGRMGFDAADGRIIRYPVVAAASPP